MLAVQDEPRQNTPLSKRRKPLKFRHPTWLVCGISRGDLPDTPKFIIESGAMRIVVDGRPVRYPLAGVGQYVANLSTALVRRDVDLRVFLTGGASNKDATRLVEVLGHEHTHATRIGHRPVTALLRYAPKIPMSLVGGSCDVYHSTYFEGYPRPTRTRSLVSTIHDVVFMDNPELFPRQNLRASRWALERQVKDSQQIICVSEYTKDRLVHVTEADPDRVRVIPLAVSGLDLPAEDAVSLRHAAGIDRPYALYVGNLEPRKDVPTLITAWASSDASREFSLILAGAPAYLSSSTQKAIADAPDHTDIRSLGYVDERTKAALLSGAEVFVYPSIYEGFGIPVLEAMHYGTPVIACDTSSIPEVLGDTGLLVPPGDSDGMSETIDILMSNDSLRTRLGDAGRERSKLFSWDLVAERTVEVYRQSVARL